MQLAGAFLFLNTGPDDGRLGRDVHTPGRDDAPYATYIDPPLDSPMDDSDDAIIYSK